MKPHTDEPIVSAIFGNFNGRRFLQGCLTSIQHQTYRNIEIIFVDDESTDGSADFVRDQFPAAKVIVNTRAEKGFAACCDTGSRAASGDYQLFLNVDVELEPDCVHRLVSRMVEDPSIGVCGPKLLSLSRRDVIVSTGGYIDVLGYGMDRGLDEIDTGKFSSSEEVTFITGAVVLVSKDALVASGGWDVDTFTYAEDSDLCWRILLDGYRVVYEPSSVAYHFQSPSMGRASPKKIHFMERNRLAAMIKNYSLRTLMKVTPAWFLIAIARMVYFTSKRRPDIVAASLRAYFQVLRNLPRTMRKRALVQAGRRVSDRDVLRHFKVESLEARLLFSGRSRMT